MRGDQRSIAQAGGKPVGGGVEAVAREATPGANRVPVLRPSPVLALLFVVVTSYAALGKGFAYAGVPPVFVGEVALVVVGVAVVVQPMPLPRNAAAATAAGVAALAAVQLVVDRLGATVPVVESLRGLAPIYYAAFAFATYALLRRQEERDGRVAVAALVDSAVARAAPWVVAALALLAALLLAEPDGLPTWPMSGTPVLASKPGDIAVALVLTLPFTFGCGVASRARTIGAVVPLLWSLAAVLVTFRSRGALLALAIGVLAVRPRATRVLRGAMAALAVVLSLYVSGVSVEVRRGREVSYQALADAAASLLGTQPDDEIEGSYVGTARWRAEWWRAIWDDVTGERMVLHGHGWGDNLAVRYGVVDPGTLPDGQPILRLPHNVFFSLAGRAGVLVAVAFLAVPVLSVVRSFTSPAVRRGPPRLVQGARGAAVAALVTGMVDVYLESPQGGILLWTLVGYLWWATAMPLRTAAATDSPRPGVAA
jgi:hypothetical protein|nr:O-antigen ligase domain-containing protein [Thermoanaerobacterales bacterium]